MSERKAKGRTGSWRRTIDGAELPRSLSDLAHAVVRRSRLRGGARADVAAEVVSHFREGLDQGRSADDLAASFGDLADAARLIRRAKARQRPLPVVIVTRATQGVGLVLLLALLVYAAEAVRFHTAKPVIAKRFISDHDAALAGIPEGDRAWPLYRRLIIELDPLRDRLDEIGGAGDEADAVLIEFASARPELLDLTREAAARPRYGGPLDHRADGPVMAAMNMDPVADPDKLASDPFVVGVLLPQVRPMRTAVQLLRVEGLEALRAGDAERFTENVEAMIGIAGHAAEHSFAINALVSAAIFAHACDTIAVGVHERPGALGAAQLGRLAHRVAGFWGGGERLRPDLTMESWFGADLIQRLYSDDGAGGGRVTAAGYNEVMDPDLLGHRPSPLAVAVQPIAGIVTADRRAMQAHWDETWARFNAALDRPLWEHRAAGGAAILEMALYEDPIGKVRFWPAATLMPALDSFVETFGHTTQSREAALTILALEAYRKERGALPASLDDLVPAYLSSVPRDQLHGTPLRYERRAGSYVLYSLGADADDDGATPALHGDGSRRQDVRRDPGTDGDLVLFPPEADV